MRSIKKIDINYDEVNEFVRRVKSQFFSKGFINNLSPKFQRKLDKRLADLWKEMKKDNLIP